MDRLVCYTAVFSGKERCVTTLRTALYIRLWTVWIGLLPFFKGSLTLENNAVFSSHCFTLRQRRNSTINSEKDHNLKPLKTDISTIVPWVDAMFGAWSGFQASPLGDLRDHVGLLNQQERRRRSVFLVQIFRRTSVQYDSVVSVSYTHLTLPTIYSV